MLQFYTEALGTHAFQGFIRQSRKNSATAPVSLVRTIGKLFSSLLLTFLGMVLSAGQASATDIYLSPNGTGTGTGGWANAANGTTYMASVAFLGNISDDTHFYLKTGIYTVTNTAYTRLGLNNTMQGGFPTSATGTDKSGYNPTDNPTTINVFGTAFLTTSSTGSQAASTIELKGIRFIGTGGGGAAIFDGHGSSGVGLSPGQFKGTDLYVSQFKSVSPFVLAGSGNGMAHTNFANSVFYDNANQAIGGGAIYVISNVNILTVDDCSFIKNVCTGTKGGGAIFTMSDLNVTNSYFCENKGSTGGAIMNDPNGSACVFTITGSTFYKNEATGGLGGAIANNPGALHVTNSNFYENTTLYAGGAIFKGPNVGGTTNNITNCIFYKNGVTQAFSNYGGGAISLFLPDYTDFPISNSKFVENYSTLEPGGAIYVYSQSVGGYKVGLDNCLFSGNTYQGSSTSVGSDFVTALAGPGNVMKFVVKNSKIQLSAAASPPYQTSGGNCCFAWPYDFSGGGNTPNNTDNGGVTAFAGSCPSAITPVAINVTGQVWDDVNGNVTFEGSENGTNAGGPLYVNLVDGTGTVITSTTVSATGSYTLSAPTSTTGLKLVLTNTATSNIPGSLPSQWVNTGEIAGSGNSASQSVTLGQIELTTTTITVSGANFGIEHLPTPGSGTATVGNPGGTNPVIVPPSAFTSTVGANDNGDTPPGSVTAIKITNFPTNVTSLTINGTVYTSIPAGGITVPTTSNGAPTVPILVDPTNDTQPVSFTYTAIDNAGKESTTTGTAVINFLPTLTVSGQVWDDVNGNVVFEGSENGTNAGGPLYVNLVDGTGTVVGSTTVSASGNYSLTGVPTNTSGLKLVLTNTATSTTPGSLPSQWVNTGENVGAGNLATQSATVGQIELNTGTSAITAQNFGIEHLPTPGSGTATVSNAGGTSPVVVPPSAFTSTSPSSDNGDTPPGSVTAIKITNFPTNVTSLTINGTTYMAGTFPGTGVVVPTNGNGAPSVPILVDPTIDSQPVSFTFTAIDNAGKESNTTGTAILLPSPDLSPIIYARPSTLYNTTNITVVVDLFELLGVPTSGLITVRVTKDTKVSLNFDPGATLINGRSVNNSVWSVNAVSDVNYYILTTNQVVAAGDKLSFGFTGVMTPGATTGKLTLSAAITGGSGGEVRINNNVDADVIDYFQQ